MRVNAPASLVDSLINLVARRAQGSNYTLQIPTALKSGQYLMRSVLSSVQLALWFLRLTSSSRHEIIALHGAEKSWGGNIDEGADGSQHYMQCLQLDVQSDGSDFPSDDYMVAFPGAYKKDDPGLHLNIWWPLPLKNEYIVCLCCGRCDFLPDSHCQIPGPKLWNGGSSSGSGAGSDSDSSSTPSSSSGSESESESESEDTTGSEAPEAVNNGSLDLAGSKKFKKCGLVKKHRMGKH